MFVQYRSLVDSETLEFNIRCHYPIHWNDHQEWVLSLTGCKASVSLIYAHKWFFQDMVNDWSSKANPDILHFVPYTWKVGLMLKEFELITLSNEYNWVDCSSQNQENAHIAFCGDLFDLSFDLPFTEFLPQTVPLRFWIQGECVDLSLYLPEVSSSRAILLALDKNAKILGREGKHQVRRWRKLCQRSSGWVDCWSVPIVALSINYTYHPMPPQGPPPQANITTPEKEEILLSPMRIPHLQKPQTMHWKQEAGGPKFDPMTLEPDKVSVELEIGSSLLLSGGSEGENGDKKLFDPRHYRPIEVTACVTLHDIQAHLVKHCGEKDPPCPVVIIERLGFEMKKSYQETTLQLLVSPAILLSSDLVPRRLQIRGHAMFSDEGRSLDQETLEYAWMIEIQLGRLSGKLTAPQLYHLVTSLETFILLAMDGENCLRPPRLPRLCHHGNEPQQCTISADLASPIRISNCNLHGSQVRSGVTALLPVVIARQLVSTGGGYCGTNRSQGSSKGDSSEPWLEVGSVSLGPLVVEAAISLSCPEHSLHLIQHKYLRTHDERTKRLWFLWNADTPNSNSNKPVGKCGCIGGCLFFGQNMNGPKFFKPGRQDLQDGINVAAYSECDPGFGQSILHEAQLVFHTPPYSSHEIVSLQEPSSWDTSSNRRDILLKVPRDRPVCERSSSMTDTHCSKTSGASPMTAIEGAHSLGRRFSYTTGFKPNKDVPYARLMDSPNFLPKLDSDSRLHTNVRSKSVLNVPETPKTSCSDSKLAVDYFIQAEEEIVGSHHSLTEEMKVQRTVSMGSENQSEAFFSADEDTTTLSGGESYYSAEE
ncbi:hypothetical protein B566_EDAN016815, partial [Ephemera danica]